MKVKINKLFQETSSSVWEINFILYFFVSADGKIYLSIT